MIVLHCILLCPIVVAMRNADMFDYGELFYAEMVARLHEILVAIKPRICNVMAEGDAWMMKILCYCDLSICQVCCWPSYHEDQGTVSLKFTIFKLLMDTSGVKLSFF